MANSVLPVKFASVVGRFLVAGNDSRDRGTEPDFTPLPCGGRLVPSVKHVLVSGAEPPVTIALAEIEFGFDRDGYLVGAESGQRGVSVIAPDESVNPTGFTYRAEFDDGVLPSFSFKVEPGATIDLTRVGRVAGSVGSVISRGVGVSSVTHEDGHLVFHFDDGSRSAVFLPGGGVPGPEPEPELVPIWSDSFETVDIDPVWEFYGTHNPPGARPIPGDEPLFSATRDFEGGDYRFDFEVEFPPELGPGDFFMVQFQVGNDDSVHYFSSAMSPERGGATECIAGSEAGGVGTSTNVSPAGTRFSVRYIDGMLYAYSDGVLLHGAPFECPPASGLVGIVVQSTVGGGIKRIARYPL